MFCSSTTQLLQNKPFYYSCYYNYQKSKPRELDHRFDRCIVVPTQIRRLLSVIEYRKSEFDVLQKAAVRLLLFKNIYALNKTVEKLFFLGVS